MTPLQVETTEGGDVYGSPVLGPVNHTAPVEVDVSDLSDDEVDDDGVLKPGVVVKKDGTLPDGTSGEFAYGVVLEPVKIAEGNDDLSGEDDIIVAVGTIAQIQRAVAEDNLGRVYTSDEEAAIEAAGSRLVLVE